MTEEKNKWVNPQNLPLIVAIIGLIGTIMVTNLNIAATRRLEEKKFEATLISTAINADDKIKTTKSLAFLIKCGLISEDNQQILINLSDSLSFTPSNNFLTSNDTCVFYSFTIRADDKEMFQGNTLVTFQGKDEMSSVRLSSFTDHQGRIEFSFPLFFQGKTFQITIEKHGYKTVIYEYTFPPDMRDKAILPHREIVLQK